MQHVCLAGLLVLLSAGPPEGQPKPVPLVHGRDTTYITEPLDKAGRIDYLRAFDEARSKGVTRENNAAAKLAEVVDFGLRKDEHDVDLFYERLGFAAPPKPGDDAFVDFDDLREVYSRTDELDSPVRDGAAERKRILAALKTHGVDIPDTPDTFDAIDLFGDAQIASTDGPWRPDDSPIAAAYLSLNQRALDVAVEASRRDRFYLPESQIGPEVKVRMNSSVLGGGSSVRHIVRGLCVRSMRRLDQGNFQGARSDLLAMQRLGNLYTQRRTVIGALIAISIDALWLGAIKDMAVSDKLNAEQARTLRDDVRSLRHEIPFRQIISQGERFYALDTVQWLDDPVLWKQFLDPPDFFKNFMPPALPNAPFLDQYLDRNAVMRRVNSHYDNLDRRIADKHWNLDADDLIAQGERVDAMAKPIARMMYDMAFWQRFSMPFGVNRKQLVTDRISRFHDDLITGTLANIAKLIRRIETRRDLTQVALTLAIYRADHGMYPAGLHALTPRFIKAVPNDRYDKKGGPLRYRRQGDGYVLYSVGPNGIDDGGERSTLDSEDLDKDDIAVEAE